MTQRMGNTGSETLEESCPRSGDPGENGCPANSSEPGRIVGNFPALGMACGRRFGLASDELVSKAQGHVS